MLKIELMHSKIKSHAFSDDSENFKNKKNEHFLNYEHLKKAVKTTPARLQLQVRKRAVTSHSR